MDSNAKKSQEQGRFDLEEYVLTNLWVSEVIFVMIVMALSYFLYVHKIALPEHLSLPIYLLSWMLSAMIGVVGAVLLSMCRIVDGVILLVGFSLNVQVIYYGFTHAS